MSSQHPPQPYYEPQRGAVPAGGAGFGPGGPGGPAGPAGPAGPGARGKGITVWHVATATLAAVCVVLAVLLVVRGSGDEVGSSAEANAAAACDLVAQVPEDGVELEGEIGLQLPYLLGAAHTLALLAVEQDDSYSEFSQTLSGPVTAFNATFSGNSPEFLDALADAHEAC